MKKLLLFAVFILQAIISHAQFKVCGTVTDSIGGPIEAAVVVLMDPQNGMTLQQGITTVKGEYNLNSKGEAQLLVSCLGYKQYVSSPFVISSDTVLHTIKLNSEDFLLNDVSGGFNKEDYHVGDTVTVTYQHGCLGMDVVRYVK